MKEELFQLAKRAVACKNWKWLPGMAYTDHAGVIWRVGTNGLMALEGECLPMLNDSATKGCLLDLLRKAYKDPSMTTHMIKRNKHNVWRVGRLGILPTGGEYKSELEAMVAALEAAPKESK